MINLHDAIYSLNPSVVTILGEVAYDKDGNIVDYDLATAQAKLAELQAAQTAAQTAAEAAKASALAKLTKLGLTADEITALTGN